VKKGGEGVRLGTQREGLGVVREIINDHQIILITRNAEYRRSPHITVDKIKSMLKKKKKEAEHDNQAGMPDKGAQ
jgi:cystathionine beta-lyase family protein involved in aluminum resistance